MDHDNHRNVTRLARTDAQRERVKLFCTFCQRHLEREVPDPYYGESQGFEYVLDLLEDGCGGVLDWARQQLPA